MDNAGKNWINASLSAGFVLAINLFSIAESALSANYFNWNADQFNTTSVGPIVTIQTHTYLDTTVKHSGTGSMRLEVPGNEQNQIGVEVGGNITIDKTKPLFYRWWMKFDPNFKWGPGYQGSGFAPMKMNRVKQSGDVLPGYYTFKMERNYIAVGECNNCLPYGNGGDPSPAIWNIDLNPITNPSITNWHEYIVEIKFETSRAAKDGYFKAYLDGVLKTAVTGQSYALDGMNAPVEAWGGMMVRPFPQLNGGASDGGKIWVDDISTDTTWNSIFGQPTQTALPPPPPTGLNVQ